ncbi:MAG: amidase, partial [Vicinamibacterales bacterium]
MSSPLMQPATELVRLVKHGELSAADLVRAHLDRIAAVDPTLRAFVDVRADAALAEARRQDDRSARGEPRGLLGGLPVTVKSAIEVAGLRCEAGSPSRAGTIATGDATVVARLRAAGAIILGTTNVAEMLMAYESENPLHGRTLNPWDHARTPGGSSGGESAAIAAGCSAGGIGSDGGGSIRVPAHFTGICGLKPTPGRIPGTGHQPACLGPFSLIGVVGPMARTIGDLQMLDQVLAGWDNYDPMAVPDGAGHAVESLRGTRIAFF